MYTYMRLKGPFKSGRTRTADALICFSFWEKKAGHLLCSLAAEAGTRILSLALICVIDACMRVIGV